MIGIKDIAKKAGVSPSTVSNALNGRRNVGDATRDRVLELCKEMDYQPNIMGKTLKTGLNQTIMFNFSDFDRQFYLKIIQGISDYVYAKDYDLIICTNKSCEKFMNQTFTSGCIMLDGRCNDNMLIKKAAQGYPIIVLDRLLEMPHIKSLIVNNYVPERELMEGLVEKKYRRFAFIGGLESEDNRERYQAFRDVLEEHAIPFRRENYYVGDYREKSGYQAAKLIMLTENLPDILVCANDNMAIGAIKAFRNNGVRVPEDISVCGFDDTEMAKVIGLTTVAIPNYERGYLAAQYLIENIDGAQNYDTFKISAKVKWRTSTR
ncbi:MAG: LacI family DNA-binding transcriptional regulator [Velocimicrobium sp.]